MIKMLFMFIQKVIRVLFLSSVVFYFSSCSGIYTKNHIDTSGSPSLPVYLVQKGDSLSHIAARFGVSVAELQSLNQIPNSHRIHIGQRITLPKQITIAANDSVPNYAGGRSLSGNFSGAPTTGFKDYRAFSDFTLDGGSLAPDVQEILGDAVFYISSLSWPVETSRGMSSKFGKRGRSFHEGIDLPGKRGLPIYSAHAGKVTYSGNGMRGFGNVVIIKGENDLMTVYAHNRKNLVSKGDYVEQGETIAELGSTGRTTGPHLHFETRVKDKTGNYVAVNPMLFFQQT